MKLLQDWSDVRSEFSVGKHPSSRVLYVLESVSSFAGQTKQDTIAVIESGSDERVDEGLGYRVGEALSESRNVLEMEKCCFSYVFDVMQVGESGVHDDAQVAYLGRC